MSISITEEHTFPVAPENFFAFITNPQNMTTFLGYGPVPAIKKITPLGDQSTGVGSTYRIENSDGSTHTEVITAFDPPKRFCLTIGSFTSSFRFLVHHMEEAWDCFPEGTGTKIRRTFRFFPASVIMAPVVRLIGETLWRLAMKRNHAEIARRLHNSSR